MAFVEEFRERRERRRNAIRKALFGDTPRPSRLERVFLVLTIVAGAYISYRFHLVHAHDFAVIGFAFLIAYFVVRRILLSRKTASNTGGSS